MPDSKTQAARLEAALDLSQPFEAGSHQDWLAAAERSLRGGQLDDLVTRRIEGLAIQPLYGPDDAPKALPGGPSQPGMPWTIMQRYDHPDPEVVNRQILADLERGSNGIWLRLDLASRMGFYPGDPEWEARVGVGGCSVHSIEDLERALAGVHLDMVELQLEVGMAGQRFWPYGTRGSQGLQRQPSRNGPSIDSIDSDPLSLAAERGLMRDAPEYWSSSLFEIVNRFYVSTLPYHEAGAGPIEELALALSSAKTYLDMKFEQVDVRDHDDVDALIRFRVGLSDALFVDASKLRALRQLWPRLARAYGEPESPSYVHAVAGERRGSWANHAQRVLFGTLATVGAALGGADAITIAPAADDDASRRLACNTQSILQLESQLQALLDPLAGSGLVEDLSNRLAVEAWARFQAIEGQGGMVHALRSGTVKDWVEGSIPSSDSAPTEGSRETDRMDAPKVSESGDPRAWFVERVGEALESWMDDTPHAAFTCPALIRDD